MTMMSQSDRIAYYLGMAKDLRVQAARCGDADTAGAYLELAAMWVRLAEDAGVTAANDAEPDAADEQREA
jgi:hypothetical protein